MQLRLSAEIDHFSARQNFAKRKLRKMPSWVGQDSKSHQIDSKNAPKRVKTLFSIVLEAQIEFDDNFWRAAKNIVNLLKTNLGGGF